MPVHADSVIPTWLNNFYPDFYVSLTDKENDCYTRNSGNDKTEWIPLFTNLSTAMNNWKNAARETKVAGLVSSIYSYVMLNLNFGTSSGSLAIMQAYYVFNMNNFVDNTLARATDYYNDLVENPPSSGTYTSAKITADVSQINGYATQEDNRISAANSTAASTSSVFVNTALFNDVTPIGSASKQDMGNYIFTTMNYKKVYQNLNVGSLALPPYIT